MTTDRDVRDRRGRHAIAWGGGIVIAGFALGCVISFLPVASGFRLDPPFGLDWLVLGGSLIVGAIGLAFMIYGIVELARARPPRRERHA